MGLDWAHERDVRNRSFRIVDLLPPDSDTISGRTFEDCTIYGPAVLIPILGVWFEQNSFDSDLDALLWEIPDERASVAGGIGLIDCTFKRCVLRRIGIAGKPGFIEHLRRTAFGQ